MDFENWAATRKMSSKKSSASEEETLIQVPCVGEFTPMRPVEDANIFERFRHFPCKAGDMIVWDYRIPHANALKNESKYAREAVYIGNLYCIVYLVYVFIFVSINFFGCI